MANWMKCEYYGASLDHAKPNKGLPINDRPVNLDLCETIESSDGRSRFEDPIPDPNPYQLIFVFQKNKPIIWKFINAELRDREFQRALNLMGLTEDTSSHG